MLLAWPLTQGHVTGVSLFIQSKQRTMEDLFWTTLNANGQPGDYHIVFEGEEYRFMLQGALEPSFAFRREHDEWQAVGAASKAVKDEAVEALERYLLRQH